MAKWPNTMLLGKPQGLRVLWDWNVDDAACRDGSIARTKGGRQMECLGLLILRAINI
jgi:hypothetical protein